MRARFNESLTRALAKGCVDTLASLGVQAANVSEVTVPGALEIPLALDAMAATLRYDALVAIGCVIRRRNLSLRTRLQRMWRRA